MGNRTRVQLAAEGTDVRGFGRGQPDVPPRDTKGALKVRVPDNLVELRRPGLQEGLSIDVLSRGFFRLVGLLLANLADIDAPLLALGVAIVSPMRISVLAELRIRNR